VTLLIWAGFALWALLWTGAAVAASALIHWGAGALASGDAAQLGLTVSSLPVPLWLTYWVDLEALHAALDGIIWTLESAQQALPWLGTVLQWLLPLTWLLWAAGIGLMLLLCIGAQLLARRFLRRTQTTPA
jgi:hypothetical protein